MKFWLACFVLLFLGAELFQWFAELEMSQPSGAWLVLGGMGLAAASNAAHLPKLRIKPLANTDRPTDQPENLHSSTKPPSTKPLSTKPLSTKPLSVAEQSAEDSISFKVRLPWR